MKTLVNGMPAVHPGEFLREMLDQMALTPFVFAVSIGVPLMDVSGLLNVARPVTAELGLRLGRAFGQTPQYWLNLQTAYDQKATLSSL